MYENKTYENIKNNILSKINLDTREGSFVNDMVSPVSMEFSNAYIQFKSMLDTMFIKDINDITTIEKRALDYGVIRKTGDYAIGELQAVVQAGCIIEEGDLFATDENLQFESSESIVVMKDGNISIKIKAIDVGSKYNVVANKITKVPISIPKLVSINNSTPTSGGFNVENDEEFYRRLMLQIQKPATSGNAIHYKIWATEVPGIGDAKVFPLHNGNGTVLVVPITSDKRSPSNATIEKVKNHIELNRPVCGGILTVQAPTEIIINATATLTIDTNYNISDIKNIYETNFKKYIEDSVYKLTNVDYYKCLSMFYEIEGVNTVTDFKLNNGNTNIVIGNTEIQVAGTVTINV